LTGAEGRTRTGTGLPTTPSRWRVYQVPPLRHTKISYTRQSAFWQAKYAAGKRSPSRWRVRPRWVIFRRDGRSRARARFVLSFVLLSIVDNLCKMRKNFARVPKDIKLGEEIIVTKRGWPVAMIAAMAPEKNIEWADFFPEPLELKGKLLSESSLPR
jgi:hypothetical protein